MCRRKNPGAASKPELGPSQAHGLGVGPKARSARPEEDGNAALMRVCHVLRHVPVRPQRCHAACPVWPLPLAAQACAERGGGRHGPRWQRAARAAVAMMGAHLRHYDDRMAGSGGSRGRPPRAPARSAGQRCPGWLAAPRGIHRRVDDRHVRVLRVAEDAREHFSSSGRPPQPGHRPWPRSGGVGRKAPSVRPVGGGWRRRRQVFAP